MIGTGALLPLLAVVPLLMTAVTVIARGSLLGRITMIGVPTLSMVCGIALLIHHIKVPVVATQLGGFAPAVAIPFVSDTFSALMLTVTSLAAAVSSWYIVMAGIDRYRFVPPLITMLVGGVNGALLTGDLFNLFVFIEVMLLPSYALIAVRGGARRLSVGRLFIVVNLVTSTLLLFGIAFTYGVVGTVNLAELRGAGDDPRASIAIIVVLLSLAIKAGVVPVHGWLPRAYPGTSAGTMALFSALHTKVALYAIYRLMTLAYSDPPQWLPVLIAVCVISAMVGAFGTAAGRDLRMRLAFQMVGGVGHILFGAALLTAATLAAGAFYMVHHIITMAGLLLLIGALEYTYGSGRITALSGIMRRDPILTLMVALGLFSLLGLPPSSGLWAKLALVAAVAQSGGTTAVVVIATILASSLVSMIALQRLWSVVFWGSPMTHYRPEDEHGVRPRAMPLPDHVRVSARMLAPGATLIGVSLLLFIAAGPLEPLGERVGNSLIDPSAYVQAVLR